MPGSRKEQMRIEQQLHTSVGELLDFGLPYPVKIVRDGDVPLKESSPLQLAGYGGAQGNDLDQRFAYLRNDERFTLCGLIHQP